MSTSSTATSAPLVDGARSAGFIFLQRTPEKVYARILGEVQAFQLFHVVPFSSDRKRMSVIARKIEPRTAALEMLCKARQHTQCTPSLRAPPGYCRA